MKQTYDLLPEYDSRQSFYSKARVEHDGDTKTLYSYNTPVARITKGGKFKLLIGKEDSSMTTNRHIIEFYKQEIDSSEYQLDDKGKSVKVNMSFLEKKYATNKDKGI